MSQLISADEAKNYLKKCRDEQIRDGEMVVRLWEQVLMDQSHKLGDELWLVYEQVCIAALDCRRTDVAEACKEALAAKFPGSLRVKRLDGMLYEAEGRFHQADKIYQEILEEDSSNMYARKRQVAILKAQRKITEAIDKLNKYLEDFMTDYEAWMELCDLYLEEQDYSKASFCMEELIMSNPHCHLYYQRFAEIKYTEGGNENMNMARSYFAQAVKLNANNMRALFGFFHSSYNLASLSQKNSKEKQSNIRYASWAAEQIAVKYKTTQPSEQTRETRVIESIEKMMESLQSG